MTWLEQEIEMTVPTADEQTAEVAKEAAGIPESVAAVKVGKKQGFLSRFGRKKKGEADADQSATSSPTIKAGGPAAGAGEAAVVAGEESASALF